MGLLPRTIGRLLLAACTLAALSSSCAALEEKVCLGTNRGFEEPTNYDTYLREMRDRYTGCTFVQGNLELTWLRSGDLDLSFLSNIREVSGYVLLFNVGVRRVPLTSLQTIRGEKLMTTTAQREAFAFLATTVTTQYLEMPALREIRRGIVGFLQSYNLCHIKDIEWKYINPEWRSNIFDITSDTECSPCDATCSGECWGPGPQNCQTSNNQKCHSECPGRCFGEGYMDCCHSYCSIGCTGSLPKDCIACKHYINDGNCVISCPRGKYKYGATCVNECPHPMLKENDACVPVCPPGKRAVQGECITCEGHCHKVCDGVGVIHSGNVRSFQNCTTIQGSLEIKNISFTGFQKFHSNFVPGPLYEEMHPDALEVFNTVKEITGHLSVSGSHPSFEDLTFFRSLEVIGGDILTDDQAALSIEKTSLKTLGLRSLRKVPKGNIIIRENKDLCLLKQRDWNEIKKSPTHSVEIQGNRPKNDCERQGYICHEQCSSDGCWGTNLNECYSCSNYKLKESCIGPCLNSSEQAGGMQNDDEICFTKAFLPGISLYIIDENAKELVDGLAWDDKISHAYVTTHKQYQIWMQHLAGLLPFSSQNQGGDIKKCPNQEINWVDAANGTIPQGGFLGGTDTKCMLYVGRTRHEGELLPGKICPRYNSVYVAWLGREHIYNNYQVLTGSNFEWILSSGTRIPACAVEGGKLKDGTPVYIGRTYNAGALDIGRVNPTDGNLYIGYYGKEYSFTSYEILVFKSQETIDNDANAIHSNKCSRMTSEWEDVPTGNITTERLVSTNDSKCNHYVGRATHDGDLIPGKFVVEYRNVYIAWGGQEIAYPQFQLLIGDNYEWIPATRGKIPDCAVKGGQTVDGTPLYIGKAFNGDCEEIGKVNPVDGLLYVGYFNIEYTFTEYDILIYKTSPASQSPVKTEDIDTIHSNKCSRMTSEWEDLPTGNIKTEKLVSTNDSKCNHYVGRATHEGDLIPGKFVVEYRNVYIAWGGQEIAYPQLQLLIGDNYEWIPATGGKIPDCAVKGGQTVNGTTLYIGKAFNGDCEEIGKVNPVDGLLYVGYFNKEFNYTEYDILIYKTSPASQSPVKTEDIDTIHSNRCSRMTSQWEDVPIGNIATERLVSTNDSKCNHYVGRTTHGGDLIPGKYFLPHRKLYVAWDGQEIAYSTSQLLIGDYYEWIPATRGKIPDCAVKGGHTVDGTPLYIGKAFNGDCEEIGKVNPVDGLLYVGYFNKEYTYAEYDILVYKAIPEPQSLMKPEDIEREDIKKCPNRQINWVDDANRAIPQGGFLGGTDTKCMLYVGRTRHDGELLPGKVCPRYHSIYVSWRGREHEYHNYQVLTGSNFEWILSSGTRIPACAVEGGMLKDGTPVYIGRTYNAGALEIGRVNPTDGNLYIGYYGKEYNFTAYEILVFKSQESIDNDADAIHSNKCSRMTSEWKDVPTGNITTERLVSTNDSKCNHYVGRATHDGDLIPGKFVVEYRNVYIAWGGQAIAYPQFQLLIGDSYEWIPATRGKIPDCAVKGGQTVDGTPLYIGKAFKGDCEEIGKVNPVDGLLYVAYFNKEYTFTEYDILIYKTSPTSPSPLKAKDIETINTNRCSRMTSVWEDVPTGNILSERLVSTNDSKCNHYVGRATHNGDLIPGKFFLHFRNVYISWGGQEIAYQQAQLLIGNNYEWIPATRGKIPDCAVKGGHTVNGTPLYIGKAFNGDCEEIGKVNPVDGLLYVGYFSKEYNYTEYDILVYKTSPASQSPVETGDIETIYPSICSDMTSQWEDFPTGNISIERLVSTNDFQCNHYVGRATHHRDLIPGKFILQYRNVYIVWGRQEFAYPQLQLLIGNNYEWVPTTRGKIPDCAVKGGQTFAGTPLYIGKAFFHGCDEVGKVNPVDGLLYVGYFNKEYTFTEYDILVYQTAQTTIIPEEEEDIQRN